MHYIANTVYSARSKDCWGLEKGEKRQIRHGGTDELCWELSALVNGEWRKAKIDGVVDIIDADSQPPCPVDGMSYQPWYQIGEGKEPNIARARASAMWPAATLEQLQDKQALMDRLPKLIAEFIEVVESPLLGFTF
jgi:hypothetical protein